MEWIYLAEDRVQWRAHVNTVINLRVPHNDGSFLTSYVTNGFTRRTLFHGVSQSATYLVLSVRLLVRNKIQDKRERGTGMS
jgi:hypothetical protein